MITSVALVPLLVDDYDRAKEFYCGKLGFEVVEDVERADKRWVRIRAPGGGGSEILLSRAIDEIQKRAIGNQAGGRVFFFLHTDDFESDYRRFQAMGVQFEEAPRNEAYGKVAVFQDLYGNRIDLIQPKAG